MGPDDRERRAVPAAALRHAHTYAHSVANCDPHTDSNTNS
jgi:hypothetical protein